MTEDSGIEDIHLMVDIETMGIAPGSAVLAIGAVSFDPYSNEFPGDTFYQKTTLKSALMDGFKVDGSVIEFWLKQSDAAKNELFNNNISDFLSCYGLISQFNIFCKGLKETGNLFIWCNGLSFDLPLIEAAFFKYDLPFPWKYNAGRDCRTLYALAKFDSKKFPREKRLIEHHALYDAMHQVKLVRVAIGMLKTGKVE